MNNSNNIKRKIVVEIDPSNSAKKLKKVNNIFNQIANSETFSNTSKTLRDFTFKNRKVNGFYITKKEENIFVTIISKKLKEILRDIINDDKFYDNKPVFNADFFFVHHIELKKLKYDSFYNCKQLNYFVNFLDNYFKKDIKKLNDMKKDGVINFNSLDYYFKKGDQVYEYDRYNQIVAGKISNCRFVHTFFGTFYDIEMKVTAAGKKGFFQTDTSGTINYFKGFKKINELSIRKLTPEIKKISKLLF